MMDEKVYKAISRSISIAEELVADVANLRRTTNRDGKIPRGPANAVLGKAQNLTSYLRDVKNEAFRN
jgi:hypothetical protein